MKTVISILFITVILSTGILPAQNNPNWVRTWGETRNGDIFTSEAAEVVSFDFDDSGNIFTAIANLKENLKWEYVIRKYSPAGDSLSFGKLGNINDNIRPNNIQLTEEQFVLVSGDARLHRFVDPGFTFYSTDIESKFVLDSNHIFAISKSRRLQKFTSTGQMIYQTSPITYPTNASYQIHSIARDGLGNTMITGSFSLAILGHLIKTYFFNKFDVNGNPSWNWTGGIGEDDIITPRKIVSNNNGKFYFLLRNHIFTSIQTKIQISKYSVNNQLMWSTDYNGIGNGIDMYNDTKIDSKGNLYIVAESKGVAFGLDFVILKYDTLGNLNWEKRFSGSSNMNSSARSIYIDDNDYIFVTGSIGRTGTGKNIFTVVLDTEGNVLWNSEYNNSIANLDDEGIFIKANFGKVYVGGYSMNETGGKESILLSYDNPVNISNMSEVIPSEFKLYQNFPNPFNPVTQINFDVRENADVVIKLYDINGREIRRLVNDFYSAGSYSVNVNLGGLSSGVYFYTMQSKDYFANKKMLLIK